ncbi:hypothetical protein BSKO_05854 [Bryopsis sp. KO-2023]|nr:hypothetical protein BSKO_05854 [Bryopsis sp. KO-2023]
MTRVCSSIAWLLAASLLLHLNFARGDGSRDLLQTSALKVRNAKTARDVFGGLEGGETIELTFEELELSETLVIDKANVTIRGGDGNSKPTLRCPEGTNALTISATGVTLENVVFEGCKEVPGVVIVEAPRNAPVEEEIVISVSFSRVEFLNNTLSPFDGEAPLTLLEGVSATVFESVFSGNEGTASGGISIQGGRLTVEKSDFTDNTAVTSGGAISGIGKQARLRTAVNISSCSFERNRVRLGITGEEPNRDRFGKPLELVQYYVFEFAQGRGGAVGLQNMKEVLIQNSTFKGNVAAAGGGIAVVSDSGVDDGSVKLLGSDFDGNEAGFVGEPGQFEQRDDEVLQGGSIFLFIVDVGMPVDMIDCTVKNSRAVFGGGVHIVASDRTKAMIESCVFENNQASKAGGGFLFRNTRVEWANSNVINCKAEVGGGVLLTNNADLTISGPSEFNGELVGNSNSEFRDNMAVDGGGILCVFCGPVTLQGGHFINNTATRNGGGLALLDGIAEISLSNFLFEKNSALRGGGIYLDTTAQLHLHTPPQFFELQPSTFRKNRAVAGGGLFAVARSLRENVLRVQETLFVENEAVVVESFKPDTVAEDLLSGGLRELKQSDSGLRTDSEKVGVGSDGEEVGENEQGGGQDLLSSCGSGGGGGICLVLDEVPEVAIVRVFLSKLELRKNKAAVGGAIFAAVTGNGWSKDRCEDPPTPTAAPCRSFRIETATISDNVAEFWGGGVFVSDPSSMYAKCEDDDGFDDDYDYEDYDPNAPFDPTAFEVIDNSMSLLDIWKEGKQKERCINVVDNIVKDSDGTFGPQVASSGVALELVWPKDLLSVNQTSGKRMVFNESNPEQGIQLRVIDAFNQTVTGGVPENEIDVTLSTPTDAIRGQQIYKARNGIVNVNSTDVLGEHVEHSLTFSAGQLASVNTTFVIRDCVAGESEGEVFKECRVCEIDKYSFLPGKGCQECESNAICSGGAALVPRPGFWHSTPYAPQFHECLIRDACDFVDRKEGLIAFYSNASSLAPSDKPDPDYQQCSTGYKGRLCGSCKDGYGHFSGGECVKCRRSKLTGFLIFLVALWSSVLVLFEIFNSMSANRDFMKAFDEDPQTLQNQSAVRESRTGPALASRSVQEAPEEFIPDYVEAFENLTETVKIFINYLQVTSLAVTINLSWNKVIKVLLRIHELFAGLSNGSAFIPLDCSFDRNYEIPGSILAIWLRIMFPVMLLIFFLVFCVLGWVAMRWVQSMKRMPKEVVSTLKTYVIIITIAVVFFAYNGVTEELMRTVNCVDIDDEENKVSVNNPNRIFNAKVGGQVWAEDTELVCFQGQHTATGVVGILGLVFFSAGFIFFIIGLLTFNRDMVKEKQFLSRYGFLYRAYRTEYYTIYWEALVTLRKAFIGAAVVYAYHLGPNLQAVLALGILILALFFQLLFRPYRDIRTRKCGGFMSNWGFMELMGLNHLETFSILMSTITFYSGIVFNDSNTSDAGNIMMAIFVIMMNMGYSLNMLLRIWGGLHVALDEKIKCLASACRGVHHERLFWISKIGILVNYYTVQIKTKLRGAATSRRNQTEMTKQGARV